ncbi:MAG TPA: TetR/AcrR family transcriptional regulator [Lutibacter sp.]|nr:TetR/AcrR family transcriptional regulator [Lutibacter sp.]
MKNKILQTASQLFLSLGFKSVTMDDIAEKMAISKKTIYESFQSKTALVKASTHFIFEQISRKIDSICCKDCDVNPIHTLFHINDFLLIQLKVNNAPEFQLYKYYPSIAASLTEKKFKLITEGITENLENGIEKGLYRKDINIAIIARLYYSTMNAIKTTDIFPIDTYKMSEVMHIFLLYHIRAIATEKGLQELESYLKEQNKIA